MRLLRQQKLLSLPPPAPPPPPRAFQLRQRLHLLLLLRRPLSSLPVHQPRVGVALQVTLPLYLSSHRVPWGTWPPHGQLPLALALRPCRLPPSLAHVLSQAPRRILPRCPSQRRLHPHSKASVVPLPALSVVRPRTPQRSIGAPPAVLLVSIKRPSVPSRGRVAHARYVGGWTTPPASTYARIVAQRGTTGR